MAREGDKRSTCKGTPELSINNDDDIKQEWLLMWGSNDLRQQGHLVDVTLIVQEQKVQRCHRAVLAASSPYFRAMFTHDVTEHDQSEIEIKELDFSSVSAIIDYLYTGKIVINDNNVQDLLTSCSILQIIGLHGKCRRYMQSRLTIQNCIEVYSFAKILCCSELQNDAFALITRRFVDVVDSESFLKLNKDDLLDFTSADELSVDKEEIVYEATLAWLLYDVANRGSMVGEVFSHVRMALLNDDYLDQCIAKESAIMGFPHLRSQVDAAQKYKSQLKEMERSKEKGKASQECNENVSENVTTGTETDTTQDHHASNEVNKFALPQDGNTEPHSITNVKTAGDNVEKSSKSSTNNNDATDNEEQNVEFVVDKNNLEELTFMESPFYEVKLESTSYPVRIPLTVAPRAGMRTNEILLFTNGRNTILFNPVTKHYFCGVEGNQKGNESEENVSGTDMSMPVMKNAEVYAAQDGTVYVIGGLEVDKTSSVTLLRSKVFTFDVERLKWLSRAPLAEPRCMMGMGEIRGNLYVTGGKALSQGQILSCVHQYNFDDDEWRESTEMATPVYGHGCASLKDRLYVLGGKTGDRDIVDTVIFFDAVSRQWNEAPSLQVPRFLAGFTVLRTPLGSRKSPRREVIYAVGGVASEGILSSVEVFNPAYDRRWKFAEEFPGNRCAMTVTSVDGNVCVVGGHVTERNENGRFESLQKYDVFSLENLTVGSATMGGRQWRRIARHIRGISGNSCACAGVKIDEGRIASNLCKK